MRGSPAEAVSEKPGTELRVFEVDPSRLLPHPGQRLGAGMMPIFNEEVRCVP